MATSHTVRVRGWIRKVAPKHRRMTEGTSNTGRLTSFRTQCPIRIPAMVAPTAGTRGRENIEVTGYSFLVAGCSSKGLASGNAYHTTNVVEEIGAALDLGQKDIAVLKDGHPFTRLRGYLSWSTIYCFSEHGMQARFPSTSRSLDSITSSPQIAHGTDFPISARFGSGT